MFMHPHQPYTGYTVMAVGSMIIMAFNSSRCRWNIDASARAKRILPATGHHPRPGGGGHAVSSVLNAAALTYVAAFLVSLVNVLYYLTLANGGRRR